MFIDNTEKIKKIRRCSKCLLPETMPFIEFDDKGECNYCRAYRKVELRDKNELTAIADKIRRDDGRPDCIVMFSGGRDSSYLLHYVVKVLNLHPITFTYDWGMSTEVGNRNAQKMCDILGVDRIVIDRDAPKKLANVKANVEAWCKKPDLGLVPLFMAGDKQFFSEINKVSKQHDINTVFIGTNPLEKTDFKTGFCGVSPNFDADRIYSLTFGKKMKLIGYYMKSFFKNPAYFNRSMGDTMKAFFSFYSVKQEQIDIYKYVRWDENVVEDVLLNEYGWEKDPECNTTWRIGDGTAAFYNYIYYTLAGFTENDTLRSNQIREGQIDRETALAKVYEDNKVRKNSMTWYFNKIGVDMEKVLKAIENTPTRY